MHDRTKISELILGGIYIIIGLSAKTQSTCKTTLFIRQRYLDGYIRHMSGKLKNLSKIYFIPPVGQQDRYFLQ